VGKGLGPSRLDSMEDKDTSTFSGDHSLGHRLGKTLFDISLTTFQIRT